MPKGSVYPWVTVKSELLELAEEGTSYGEIRDHLSNIDGFVRHEKLPTYKLSSLRIVCVYTDIVNILAIERNKFAVSFRNGDFEEI